MQQSGRFEKKKEEIIDDKEKNKIDIIDTKVIFFIIHPPFILFFYQL